MRSTRLSDGLPNYLPHQVIDVPIGVCLAQLPTERLRIVHMPEVRR